MNPSLNDTISADLLLRVARRDQEAFGELYDRTSRVLFSVAFRILKNAATVEDLLQEIYMQVWEKADAFDPARGRPMTWLLTMTRNRAVDKIRSRQRQERLAESMAEETSELADEPSAPHHLRPAGECAAAVRNSLATLPMEQRQAIELAFFEGLSQTQIAERLATPLGTIKARIRRGMIHLRQGLKEHR